MNTFKCSECGAVGDGAARTEVTEPFDFDAAVNIEPRHHQLLKTNEPPEGSEMTFIQSVISTSGARLAFLETEISQLRDRLERLEEEQTSLSRYRAQNQAILSPLRRMPPEVLVEIFSWTVPSVRDRRARCRFHMMDGPWALTHVSGLWRSVAVSTPSLWSLLVIVWMPTSAYSLPLVKLQLQRARTIKLHFLGHEAVHSRSQIEMFQFLAGWSSCWEEFRLRLTPDLLPFLTELRDRVPSLRRLLIQDPSGIQTGDALRTIDCFRTAQSLVDAGMYSLSRTLPILLPAHQLTYYYLSGAWNMHHSILKLALNLVQARVDVKFDEGPWPPFSQVVALLHLRQLYVSRVDILTYLRAPALQEITIQHTLNDDPTLLRHLEAFIGRSGCTLRRLCLRSSPGANVTTQILRKYPSVTELGIVINPMHPYDFADTLISQLTIPGPTGGGTISPQLYMLYFGCQRSSSINHTLYLSMLQSRWKAEGCSLQRAALLIESGPKPDAATLDGLNALRQDGMDVAISYGQDAVEEMHSWPCLPRWA
ncbi:hypothetical protein DFH09DRAFT_1044749 [Mycena vulgaris]|nr:hypothetical protein DFH09DRAFT_1044749 [Mycena vulgaris]